LLYKDLCNHIAKFQSGIPYKDFFDATFAAKYGCLDNLFQKESVLENWNKTMDHAAQNGHLEDFVKFVENA
jgi:hypothetical protein